MIRIPTRFHIPRSASRAYIVFASLAFSAILAAHSTGAIVTTGNVTPDPSTTTNDFLYVGNTANGTMTVDGGSTVNSSSSYIGNAASVSGAATITGSGSKWSASSISVGYAGNGNLTVSDGGAISGSIFLGADDSGSGSLTVTGAGSKVTGSFLEIGEWGFGTLNINSGGQVSSTFGSLGTFGQGTATIDGVGSSWTMSASIELGFDGPADLTVQNGGTLASSSGSINQASDLQSTLTVTGAQSVWNNSGAINVGSFSGQGLLNINQGSMVNSGGDTTLGNLSATTGVVSFDNGTLNTGGLLTRISDLHGTGTINTHGLVTDVNLVFDQNNGLQKQIVFTDGVSQNITVNLDQSAAGSLGAGFSGNGSLTIADGVTVNSRNGVLGYRSGSNGTATVDGAGSKWSMTGNLSVGSSGTASLTIKNGAAIEVAQTTTASSSGVANIRFDAGTLNTKSLLAGVSQLGGTGTINTHGLVTDIALVFDATHSFQQQLVLNSLPNQNVTIILDVDGTSTMGAGYRGVGSLTIADGKVLNSVTGYLGYGSGSTGTATITGPGSKWLISSNLNVGNSGTGRLTVENGANVINLNGQISRLSSTTVTGVGSTWVNSDLAVSGTLLVENGADVTSAASQRSLPPGAGTGVGIGFSSGTTAKATIDGPGSTWTHTGAFIVGDLGNGSLTISAGGKLSSTSGLLGNGFISGTGSATVTGPGSLWSNAAGLTVGSESTGTLMIANGGAVTNTTGVVGDGFGIGSASSATVTGAGSSWANDGPLTIGSSQSGTLTVAAGGAVSSTSGAVGRYFSGSSAANVSGAGSIWNISGPLAVGGYFFSTSSPPVTGGAGTVTIAAGGTVQTAGDITILSQGRLNLQGGTLTTPAIRVQAVSSTAFSWTGGALHVGTFFGNLTNPSGTLSPGASPGKTTITGSYTQQSASTLEIEIGGTTSVTQYDLVAISGSTTLGGLLKLSMLNGFLPGPTDTFTVLTSNGPFSGAFSNAATGQRLATSDGFGSFLVTYSNTTRSVVLSAFQGVPEPSAGMLIAVGATSLLAASRKLRLK